MPGCRAGSHSDLEVGETCPSALAMKRLITYARDHGSAPESEWYGSGGTKQSAPLAWVAVAKQLSFNVDGIRQTASAFEGDLICIVGLT